MNQNKKIKLIGTVVGIVLFIILIAGITYAAFVWRSENINISGSSECFTINYVPGPMITNANVILFSERKIISNNTITIKNGMAVTGMSVGIDSGCAVSGKVTINLKPTTLNPAFTSSGQSTGAFKYVIASYDPNVYPTISVNTLLNNSFDIIEKGSITDTSRMILMEKDLSTTSQGYLLIFYVDGNLAQNDAQDSTFSAILDGVATQTE